MQTSYDTVRMTLASAVANAATFTVGYPTYRDSGDYAGGTAHEVVSNTYGRLKALAGDVSFSFGTSNITVTNNTGQTLAADTAIIVQLDRAGPDTDNATLADDGKMAILVPTIINLGAPDTADADGYVVSQDLTAAGVFSVSTDAATAIAAAALAGTADVPRNVVAAWTGTAVLTITAIDIYGETVVESSASGTSFAGKKAIKTLTDVSVSANVTGLTVGTGDVLGLPVALPQKGLVVGEMEDGAAPTAGTIVAASTSVATATTGDVRGTYDPNSACNGAKAFQLLALLPDPAAKGVPQYAG